MSSSQEVILREGSRVPPTLVSHPGNGSTLKHMRLGTDPSESTIYLGYRAGQFSRWTPGAPVFNSEMFMAVKNINPTRLWIDAYNVVDPVVDIEAKALLDAWSQSPTNGFNLTTATSEALERATHAAISVALANAGYTASLSVNFYDTEEKFSQALSAVYGLCGESGVRVRNPETWSTITDTGQKHGYLRKVGLRARETVEGTDEPPAMEIIDMSKAMSVDADGYLILPEGTTQESDKQANDSGTFAENVIWAAKGVLGWPNAANN